MAKGVTALAAPSLDLSGYSQRRKSRVEMETGPGYAATTIVKVKGDDSWIRVATEMLNSDMSQT